MTLTARVQKLARRLRNDPSAVEEYYRQLDITSLRDNLEKARDDPAVNVGISDLVMTATLREPQMRIGADKHALGRELHNRLQQKWKASNPSSIAAVFPPQGIVVLDNGDDSSLKISLSPVGAPEFDWSLGRAMLNRIDTTADLAKTWIRSNKARVPHLERAYAVETQILGTVQRERWRRQRSRIGPDEPPTESFLRELEAIRPQLEDAEQHFLLNVRQNAQNLYIAGMFAGGLLLAVASLIGGLLFRHYHLSAWIGVAFPAGALGAVVSVLQRVTTGGLDVDHAASVRRLVLFGVVRPWIGAIFGMVLYALLQAQVVGSTIDPPSGIGPHLAFFGVLGFFAGFNERFAQDVVSGSSARLGEAMARP